jgi:hypothetical protein
MDMVRKTGNAGGITGYLDYFSLGQFYIDVDLLEPHPCQRDLVPYHLNTLQKAFEAQGVLRTENSAVVIGLGEGWYHMKKNNPNSYRITKSCSFLSKLQTKPSGPIAQVIRGGHRTATIKNYSSQEGREDEGYWYYTVLVPGQ